MSGLFQGSFFLQVERSVPIPVRTIPSEVMRRLATGIATTGPNSKSKLFQGRLGVLNFEINAPFRGQMSIKTTGVIIPEKRLIVLQTAADSREFVLIFGMLFFVSLYFAVTQYSAKGFEALIASAVVFLMAVCCLYVFGWLSVRNHSTRHFQFIRDAVESERGFDLDQYKLQLFLDFWIYLTVAVIIIALIMLWAQSCLGF